MFSFFKKKTDAGVPAPQPAESAPSASPAAAPEAPAAPPPAAGAMGWLRKSLGLEADTQAVEPPSAPESAPAALPAEPAPATAPPARSNWMGRLRSGLQRTGNSIAAVFVNAQIDEALYEELEAALLMADAGTRATQHLLDDLRRRVKREMATDPQQVRRLLADALTDLLLPLEKPLVIGRHTPTVIMVAGVNGAGKTTSIGKLTKHLASEGATVLLAAADTFRAAAREQLGIWADRNTVEIVSQQGGDPAAVSYDAVVAGRARGKDVVLVDTAGRLPTQLHLMEELKKIKRVIAKASTEPPPGRPKAASAPWGGSEPHAVGSVGADTPPHEVLLVIDGNTGQNAVTQVKAFDDALQLTGLVVTKLDGTAKGGVLAAIAQEGLERAARGGPGPVPVYFIGVGEKLEDLETFDAREFAEALLG